MIDFPPINNEEDLIYYEEYLNKSNSIKQDNIFENNIGKYIKVIIFICNKTIVKAGILTGFNDKYLILKQNGLKTAIEINSIKMISFR